jgi:hypothetical protein
MKFFFFHPLLFVILWCVSGRAQTSVYNPFPDSSAVWNIHSNEPCGLFFDTWEYWYSYTLSGDTIIGGTDYHKLICPVQVVSSNGGCGITGTWVLPGHFAGSIRQDLPNKKVFYVPPADSVEQLLYDFNMQVGDTVKGYTAPWSGLTDTVQSIDSVLIGNDYRKRLFLDPCYQIYLIEGIGSTYGLIERSPGCITDASDFSITCFKQNSIVLFPASTTNCDLITSVNNPVEKIGSVIISPNPFHGTATLRINTSSAKFRGQLKIYDLTGRILMKQEIGSAVSLINRNGLADGIYFLRLTGNENQQVIATGKLILE